MRNVIIRLAPGAGCAALALAAALIITASPGLPIDDPYIHLAFARSLALHHEFAFNPGEFSLGFSSVLWVALAAAITKTGLAPVSGVKILGCICFALAVFLVHRIVRDTIGREFADADNPRAARFSAHAFSLVAAAGVAICGNMLWLAGSGMEATLYLLLGLAAIALLIADKPRPIAAGAALGLFILARPTGLAFTAIIAAIALIRSKNRLRSGISLALAPLICGPWFIYTFIKTGHLLPTTHAGKLASNLFNAGFSITGIKTYLIRHLVYLLLMDKGIMFLIIAAAVAAVAGAVIGRTGERSEVRGARSEARGVRSEGRAAAVLRKASPVQVLVLWGLAEFSLYAVFFRSAAAVTPYHLLRYLPMLIPAVATAAAVVLSRVARRMSENSPGSKQVQADALPLIYIIALAVLSAGFITEAARLPSWRGLYTKNTLHLQQVHRAAADWARANTRPDARIACLDIGMLGYYSGRYIIDLGGLIDPAIQPWLEEHRAGPYMVREKADFYFAMVRHDSDRITGIAQDAGKLYNLDPIIAFNYPAYASPVILHSLGLVVYRVLPPG